MFVDKQRISHSEADFLPLFLQGSQNANNVKHVSALRFDTVPRIAVESLCTSPFVNSVNTPAMPCVRLAARYHAQAETENSYGDENL